MKALIIDERELDNYIANENDMWEDDAAADEVAELLLLGIDNSCANHPEKVRGLLERLLCFLMNQYACHAQQAEWGDIEGAHETLAGRYGRVASSLMRLAQEKYGNITLRLEGLNDDALCRLPEDFKAVTLPSGKKRFVVKDDSAKEAFYAALSPRVENEKLDSLFGQLSEIKCRDLKRIWYDRLFSNHISGKDFYQLCTNVVPYRERERGWSYDNFKKA